MMSCAGEIILCLLFITILASSRCDPCEDYSQLPNPYDRYLKNNISGSEGSVLHDRHLPEGWYRAGRALDMATTPPSGVLHCGTVFPAWMNGSIPNTADGEVIREVCFLGHIQGNFCVHHLEIRVKNCGPFRVYNLPSTPSNDEAYCFDIENDNSSSPVTTSSVPDDTTSIPTPDPVTTSSVPDDTTSIPTPNPCLNYSSLPNAYERYYSNAINGSTEIYVHDRHLTEGWYRAGYSLDMPNVPPSLLHCGTRFPVWMDGKIPDTADGVVERTAFLGIAVGNYCVHHLQIRVRNCGLYRVYYLYPTPSNDEAYCFGMNKTNSVTTLPTSTIRPHTTSYVDPCSTYETLPNYESRFIQNMVNETSFFIDDKNLPEHWYRAGNWDIPRNVPNLYHCGTLYPGYLTGLVPDVTAGIVDRTVCFLGGNDNWCYHNIPIRIKNCGNYRVYLLKPTQSNSSAYCFGSISISTPSSVSSTSYPTSQTTDPILNTTGSRDSTIEQETTENLDSSQTPSDQYISFETTNSLSKMTTTTHPPQQSTTGGSILNNSTSSSQISPEAETTTELESNITYSTQSTQQQTVTSVAGFNITVSATTQTTRTSPVTTSSVPDDTTSIPTPDPVTTSSVPYDTTSTPTPDPCLNYSSLPNAYERYYSNAINGSTEIYVHDRHLTEGWYRAGYSLDMPNVPPSLLHCGTRFPVWMDGEIPDTADGVVERTACFLGIAVGNYCVHHLQIRVRNCGLYRVYYLYPTPSNDEAYCFGMNKTNSVTTLPTSTIRPHTTSYVDPCSTYETLPNYESRFIQNVVNETSFFIDDKNLPEHWYRAGNWDIPRNVPNLFHCGTLYPGYLTGLVPDVTAGIVDRTVCFLGGNDNWCYHNIPIRIKNCGNYRVYLLKPTQSNSSAYCFGSISISTPSSITSTPYPTSQTTAPILNVTGSTQSTIEQETTEHLYDSSQTPSNSSQSTQQQTVTSEPGFNITVLPTTQTGKTTSAAPDSTAVTQSSQQTIGRTSGSSITNSTEMSSQTTGRTSSILNNTTSSIDYSTKTTSNPAAITTVSVSSTTVWTNPETDVKTTPHSNITYPTQVTMEASASTATASNTISSTQPTGTTASASNVTKTSQSTSVTSHQLTTDQSLTTDSDTTKPSQFVTTSQSSMKVTTTRPLASSTTTSASTTSIIQDPCVSYVNLTNIEARFHSNQIPANASDVLSDHNLRFGWYGTGRYDILTMRPMRYHCGTLNPIWINGDIPEEEDGVVDRIACIVDESNCGTTISVQILNCGAYRVYKLRRTVINSAYCVYDGRFPTTSLPITTNRVSSTVQQTSSPNPTLSEAEVEVHLVPEGISEVFQAKCAFNASNAGDVRFNISWYFDGVFDSSYSATLENIHGTYIYLKRNNFITLGRNISCRVNMLNNGGIVIDSKRSPEKFLGIKILTPVVSFQRGEEGKIKIQLTVPIGCLQLVSQCDVILAMMDQSDDQCTGAAVSGQRDCGIALKSKEWNKIYEIPVGAIEEEGHDYSATYEVILRTDAHFHQPIWGLYELPPVKIVIEEAVDKEWSKKYCRAVNDPHILTFDQRPYDVHLKGDFIMYEHKSAPVQVQARFKPCYGNSGPHCTCGVAVQAGRDVFVIDRCQSGKRNRKMMYTSCMDHTLEVRKRHDYLYNMYTPYGTRIQVNLRGKTYMNLQIYPSIRDVGQTKGLCGTLSNECADDFLLRSGNYLNDPIANKTCGNFGWSDYRWEPNSFSSSWMVSGNESLFEDYDPSKSEWPRERYLCVCKKNVIKMRIDGRGTPDCSSSVVSNCNRRREKIVTVGGGCEVKRSSSKSMFRHYDVTRERREEPNQRRIKRYITSLVPLNTIENTTSFCHNHLFKSEAFKLCGEVPNVKTDDAVQTCALDITLTNGSLEWADNPKEALIDRCISELRLNKSLNTENNGSSSVAEKIESIACPNNCSDIGACVNGTCICPPLYGASDCSLNVSVPPEIYGIEGDGFCDVSQMSCDQILIAGDDFTETGTYHCKTDATHILFDGATSPGGLKQLNGDMQTLMSISCPVPIKEKFSSRISVRMNPLFVRMFSVSLSSDGETYSQSFEFYEYNSTYQEFQIQDGKPRFSLKTGYCFIDSQGLPDGWLRSSDTCNVCNSSVNIFDWTPVNSMRCEVTQIPVNKSFFDSDELYWLLGVAIVMAFIVSLVVCQHRFRRIKYKRRFSYDVSSKSSTSSIELQTHSLY